MTPKIIADLTRARAHAIKKGYTPEHDDEYVYGELTIHATTYISNYIGYSDREDLVKACQLIIAEIERIDRREEKA